MLAPLHMLSLSLGFIMYGSLFLIIPNRSMFRKSGSFQFSLIADFSHWHISKLLGPLMGGGGGGGGGGPQCRLSILRNGNVPCHFFRNVPVNSKIVQCRLLNLRNGNVPCHYFKNFPVDFKIVL